MEKKEAMKILKDFHDKSALFSVRTALETALPELRESKDDEEIMKLADEYYDKVLIKECDMKENEAHHCRISYIHGAKAMLERQKWRPSEEQMIALDESAGIVGMFTQRGFRLISLYNDLKKLNQQKSK